MTLKPADWYRAAESTCDRRLFARFERGPIERRVPPGSYLIGARIIRGVGQPGYACFSLRDTAFTYSWGRYWPASAIKLVAAVGALVTLRQRELSSRSRIAFRDPDGRFDGPVGRLLRRALVPSANIAYNRLMQLGGFDQINERLLVARFGTPRMVLQRRYTHPTPDANLRRSPEIRYVEGARRGVIPARTSARRYPSCPDEANCMTLFELQEVLRRVMLHAELPPSERYPLGDYDVRQLRRLLLRSPTKFEPGVSEALIGRAPPPPPAGVPTDKGWPSSRASPVRIYNKAGRVPGDDHLDSAFIVDKVHGQRYMLAASVPYRSAKEPDQVTAQQLIQIGGRALAALKRSPRPKLWLQRDAGVAISIASKVVRVELKRVTLRLALRVARGRSFTLWLGRRRLTPRSGWRIDSPVEVDMACSSESTLIAIVRDSRRRAIGYRLVTLGVHC